MTNVMIIDYYMAFIIVCFIKMFYKKRGWIPTPPPPPFTLFADIFKCCLVGQYEEGRNYLKPEPGSENLGRDEKINRRPSSYLKVNTDHGIS